MGGPPSSAVIAHRTLMTAHATIAAPVFDLARATEDGSNSNSTCLPPVRLFPRGVTVQDGLVLKVVNFLNRPGFDGAPFLGFSRILEEGVRAP